MPWTAAREVQQKSTPTTGKPITSSYMNMDGRKKRVLRMYPYMSKDHCYGCRPCCNISMCWKDLYVYAKQVKVIEIGVLPLAKTSPGKKQWHFMLKKESRSR